MFLKATVRNDRANGEQVVSIFFDLEKAHDLTRRNGILIDLDEAGEEGRTKREQHLIQLKKARAELKSLAKNTTKKTGKIC